MVAMIFKLQNKSLRHFLSFRNKLKLLPLQTYVRPLLLSFINKSIACLNSFGAFGILASREILLPTKMSLHMRARSHMHH